MVKIQESITVDNLGNELSKEQIQYFKNSKIRENGKLMVCYHGTKNKGFKEFNPSKSKSQFGSYKFNTTNVNYFSSSYENARSFSDVESSNGGVYSCYINIENPYIVNNESLAEIKSSFNIVDKNLINRRKKAFYEICSMFSKDENGEDYSVYDEDLDFINAQLSVLGVKIEKSDFYNSSDYDLVSLGNNSAFGSEHTITFGIDLDSLFEEGTIENDDFYSYVTDDDYEYLSLTTDDIVKMVLYMNRFDGTNYDGIIIEDIMDSASMFSSSATDIITLKSSNQIKEISNKTPTSSNRIDEKKTKDGMFIITGYIYD